MDASNLDKICARAGIAEGYRDAFGEWRTVPDETRRAILRALGDPDTVSEEKTGSPAGPAYLPPVIESGKRVWGFAVQLYGLRSRRNWGIGDFSDLAALVRQSASLGADVIALNPLHALFWSNPAHYSPYAPSSRLFRNPLYLDVEAVPEFSRCRDARAMVGDPRIQNGLAALRVAALVDYSAVAARKRPVLEMLYRSFRRSHLRRDGGARTERGWAFRAFQAAHGATLERFGMFEAIAERRQKDGMPDYNWRGWPEGLRRPDGPDIPAFAERHRDRIEFHAYLQWEIERQLGAVQALCRDSGMIIGLLHDLAVGFDGTGADSWQLRDILSPGMSIGAPPDLLSPNGQDWGFPPFNPPKLRACGYAPFAETIRAAMAHGGAIRIDHVLGLARQFWVPHGQPATEGGYVAFPLEAMLGVVETESRRARCLVVGEDLGTVPVGLRDRLAEARLLSYRLAYFERDDEGRLPAPRDFPSLALVASGTHDLPTLSGFWMGRDIELRREAGFFEMNDIEAELRSARRRDRHAIWRALVDAGLCRGDAEAPPEEAGPDLVRALYTYLAQTRSCLLVVQPEDLLGVLDQTNLPGTTDQHPNWRRKLPIEVETFASDARIRETSAAISPAREAGV